MDLDLLLRFLHVLVGVLTFGCLLSAWLWSLSLTGQKRGDGLGQLRFWARHGPIMGQLGLAVPLSGLILVFTKYGGSFRGWVWLSIVLFLVYQIVAVAVVGRTGTRLLKALEAAAQGEGFADVRGAVGQVQLGYGVM